MPEDVSGVALETGCDIKDKAICEGYLSQTLSFATGS